MDAVNDVLLRGASALRCDRVSERRSITEPAARHVSYIIFIFCHVFLVAKVVYGEFLSET